MDYTFTEEQRIFLSSIRDFVNKEIIPRAQEIGKLEEIPRDLWKKICNFGILESILPEHNSGKIDFTLLGIAAEEMGKGDVSLASTMIPNIAICMFLQNATKKVKEEWLEPIIRGDKLSCLAITEPDCGTDAKAMKTNARRDGEFYILNGEKTSISWGMYADVASLFAKTDPMAGTKGISCFILPLNLSGIEKSYIPDMGLKPVTRASLILENVRLPKEYLIGGEGEGFYMLMKGFDIMRVLVGLISIGAAEGVLEETVRFVKQRVAFGKPLGRFEGISFKIAENATLLEAARGLCYRALWLRDHGINHTKETAMCKWWSTKIAVDVIHDSLIMHGHIGYSSEFLIEQRLRDVIGAQLADGSPEGMKLVLVRELLGKEFLPY